MSRAIGAALTPEESAAFVEAARSLVRKVKFRHHGRVPALGLDCAGEVGWCLTVIGRHWQDVRAYGREPHKDGLRQALVTNLGQPVPKQYMRAGDVPLMRFDGEPRHIGILGDHPDGSLSLIHTYSRVKMVVEHGLDDYWLGTITEVFRP